MTKGVGRGRSRASDQGRGRSSKRSSSKKRSTEATASATRQEDQDEERGRARRGYSKAPGSQYYMLFGDDSRQQTQLPNLNEEYIPHENVQEIPLSQNALAIDDM
jgi:hypothetical protein